MDEPGAIIDIDAALGLTLGLSGAVVAALVVLIGVPRLLPFLRKRAMDAPNERSSHTVPTPRGGGLAVAGALALVLGSLGLAADPMRWAPPLVAGLGLAALSWRDDRASLGAGLRFGAQGLAVAAGLLALGDGLVFQGWLPVWADRLLAGFVWLWLINLTNFMDGIDGITIADIVPAGLGLSAVALVANAAPAASVIGLALAGAMLGFAPYNWPAARARADEVFLGDVGSIPLGYALGLGLLLLAAHGVWAAALILAAFPLTDATLTLLKRLLRRERVWEAHRSHAYQRSAARVGHAAVSARVAALNVVLAGLALLSVSWPWGALAGAALCVAALLIWMERTAGA